MILALLLAMTMAPKDQFFIISSVDLPHNRLVLKRPTETTVLATVAPQIRINDLRSGDTIYAVTRTQPDGSLMIVSLRRGGMTLEELHRRYLG
jgi:hypothetical protein